MARIAAGGQRELWRALRMSGIILMVFGVAVLAYSLYSWTIRPTPVPLYPISGTHGVQILNGSGFNQTGINYTMISSGVPGFAPVLAYVEGAAIGALMLLLGFATYKYAGLRNTARRK